MMKNKKGDLALLVVATFLLCLGICGIITSLHVHAISDDVYVQLKENGVLPIGAVAESSRDFNFWGSLIEICVGIMLCLISVLAVHEG